MTIDVFYDGKYPNLCSGHLIVLIDNKKYDFGKYVLRSGGSSDWKTGEIETGDWTFKDHIEYPKGFPMELKDEVLRQINLFIPKGCCGGCM